MLTTELLRHHAAEMVGAGLAIVLSSHEVGQFLSERT